MRPWYKKKRFIIPLVILVIIVLAQLGGGGDDAPTAVETNSPAEASPATEQSAPESESAESEPAPAETPTAEAPAEWVPPFPGAQESDLVGAPGDSIDMDGVVVTVSELTYKEDVLGEYLIASVTVQNNTDDTISYNAFEFELQNPGGSVESTTFGGTDNYLGSGDIVPGGSASGELPWEAKNGDESGKFIVLYEPISFWSSDRAAWVNER